MYKQTCRLWIAESVAKLSTLIQWISSKVIVSETASLCDVRFSKVKLAHDCIWLVGSDYDITLFLSRTFHTATLFTGNTFAHTCFRNIWMKPLLLPQLFINIAFWKVLTNYTFWDAINVRGQVQKYDVGQTTMQSPSPINTRVSEELSLKPATFHPGDGARLCVI